MGLCAPFATAVAVAFAMLTGPAAAAGLKLHVPSPDWRDQIVYFVLTDRFADGEPRNNDQGAGEYGAGERDRYNGGDLQGLRQRLAYIRGLGATAVWITPPVANQWLAPGGVDAVHNAAHNAAHNAGYHGYWAENFMQVDRHLGNLADYRALSHALHTQGMFLVQDIVLNHTGDYFHYDGRWSAANPALGYTAHSLTRPVPRPSQRPFDRNDPRDPAQRALAIYHWTPDVSDYTDPHQELNFQMSGLDDLNTENPLVRQALRRSYGHWIRKVGVDAFRIDTAFYVPRDFLADFLHARDPSAPGIARVARHTGRRQFHVFGEGFGIDKPFDDRQARKIDGYMRPANGQPLLPGMLNFPLYGALGDAFARGRPTTELAHRIARMMQIHARPHLMPSFVDNHDVDRFLAGGSVAGLRQALLAMMTLPGIPVIYYGTEQGFTEQRAAMFAAGFGAGGRDHYDMQAPLYRDIARMAALRKAHRVFSRGRPTVLQANAAQPGVLAWSMAGAKASVKDTTLVILNTAESDHLADLATQWPPGTVLEGLHGLDAKPGRLVVGAHGRLMLRLPPRSGRVWRVTPKRAPVAAGLARISLDPLPSERVEDDFSVTGSVTGKLTHTAQGMQHLLLVVDGDLAAATPISPAADGRWQARVDTSAMADPELRHTLTAWAEGQAASTTRTFQIDRPWRLLADVTDPAGDDTGPSGLSRAYTYPTDPSYGANRQMDLRGVKVFSAGGALRLDLQMHSVSSSWNPANGFDHVAFTVFIELPGREGGARVMPLQDASLPDGMRWHLRLRAGGWSNALFEADGASASAEGRPVTPGASIRVDAASQTVSLTVPAAALGKGATLSGARVYVTTWDYDGGYRALGTEAQPFAMGGGAAGQPKVMDASAVIVLP